MRENNGDRTPFIRTARRHGEYTDNMNIYEYDRAAAAAYARKWAYGRNPAYYDFNDIGGDCTNFASQCVYAGCGVMNYTPVFGWFYISTNNRTPSWTGVEFLYKFLTGNDGVGPFAEIIDPLDAQVGDIIQLGDRTSKFFHSPVVVDAPRGGARRLSQILIAAHTYDALDKPISSYNAYKLRALHIKGYRK